MAATKYRDKTAVIVGRGFVGIACAKALAEREIVVTLIDKRAVIAEFGKNLARLWTVRAPVERGTVAAVLDADDLGLQALEFGVVDHTLRLEVGESREFVGGTGRRSGRILDVCALAAVLRLAASIACSLIL